MTREEAIDMLVKDKEQRGKCFISEALDMAIKALEQEIVLDKVKAEVKAMSGDIETIADVLDIIDNYKKSEES